METGGPEILARGKRVQGEEMLEAEEVAAMVRLHELGWGAKRLSKEFGCARNTVRRYLRAGGSAPFRRPERKTAFDGLVRGGSVCLNTVRGVSKWMSRPFQAAAGIGVARLMYA
jgi:hypothetical protein